MTEELAPNAPSDAVARLEFLEHALDRQLSALHDAHAVVASAVALRMVHVDQVRATAAHVRSARDAVAAERRPVSVDGGAGSVTSASLRFVPSDEFERRSLRAEIALATRVTERTAERWLEQSETIVRELPELYDELAAGRVSEQHCAAMVQETNGVPIEERAALVRELLPTARRCNPARLRTRVRAARERIDPAAKVARHREALHERRVVLEPADDGMAWLGLHLPAEHAVGAYDRLTQEARAIRAAGGADGRSLAQLRADLAAELLVSAPAAEGAGAPRITPTVYLTVPVLSLLGADDDLPVLQGYGPIDVGTAARLCADAPHFIRVLVQPVDGTILALDRERYRITGHLRTYLTLRGGTCGFVGCGRPATECDIDHTEQWSAGGGSNIDNLAALCLGHHVLKDNTAWVYRHLDRRGTLEWTAPSGRTYLKRPERAALDASPTPPVQRPGSSSATGPPSASPEMPDGRPPPTAGGG